MTSNSPERMANPDSDPGATNPSNTDPNVAETIDDPNVFKTLTRQTENVRLELAKMSIESGVTFDEIMRRACLLCAQTLQIARVGIWMLVDQGKTLKCVHLYESHSCSWSSGTVLQVSDFPGYFSYLSERKVIPSETAQSDPKIVELVELYLKPLGITSTLDAPIFVRGEVTGVLSHEHIGPPREWTTEERDFAASVADLLAVKHRAAEIKQLQESLRLSETRLMALEKSDALAKMALGIAHDFRNLLTTVSSGTYLLKSDKNLPAHLHEAVDLIAAAAARGSTLIGELVEYGRSQPNRPTAMRPAEMIEQFLPVLKTAVGGRCEVCTENTIGKSKIFMDRNQFDRVLLNLVLNAHDASNSKGTITIRTRPSLETEGGRENFITLEVSDQGCGMDPETAERMFEPFFTTKSQGTGLGMAIVQRIVERAGGYIRVESHPGKGTSVRVHLPRVSVSD